MAFAGQKPKDLKRSRQVISNYLYYLEYCFILKSLKNFKGSLKVSSRATGRFINTNLLVVTR
jgi:predicted AAA+ superfamily ATPase